MDGRRTYPDSVNAQVNAGRPRRSYASLEQLNRSLETLEQRLHRHHDEPPPPRQPAFARQQAAPAAERRWQDRSYQGIAHEIDAVRGQEEGLAEMHRIAADLNGLREEMRQTLSVGVRREFETLRHDLDRAQSVGTGKVAAALGQEFDRLSGAIQTLAERNDDRGAPQIRADLEEMKLALQSLAREDSLQAADRRWSEVGERLGGVEDLLQADRRERENDPLLATLSRRVDQLGEALSALPAALSVRPLEDKVRTLAGALDHFVNSQSGRTDETLGQIAERLDEIARALVAVSASAQSPQIDHEPFERIEARIAALARQIEEVSDPREVQETHRRLDVLAGKVDRVAARAEETDPALAALVAQVAALSDKIEAMPAAADPSGIFDGIDRRFESLAAIIEQRQDDALEQGSSLLRDIGERIDSVARSVEAERPAPATEHMLRGLEAKLDGISDRLEHSAARAATMDPAVMDSLEAQVAELSRHLSRASAPMPAFDDIAPRLDIIERSLAGNRESLLEAARHAAEAAAQSLVGNTVETQAVAGLVEDLKALDTLTRRSDERNGKTFEAIHDTLIKIVERLGTMEPTPATAAPTAEPRKLPLLDAPSIDPEMGAGEPVESAPRRERDGRMDRTPAQAAAAAALAALGSDAPSGIDQAKRSRSLLSGLGRAFSGKKADQPAAARPAEAVATEPESGLDKPLDPKLANRPLEPGSGAPDLSAIMRRVRDERGQPAKPEESNAAKSDFIAAARRAAQAAAAEAEAMKRKSELGGPVKALRLGDLLKVRKKPILMAAAAIMLALAGLQLGKAFLEEQAQTAALAEPELDRMALGSTQKAPAKPVVKTAAAPAVAAPAKPQVSVAIVEPKAPEPAAPANPAPPMVKPRTAALAMTTPPQTAAAEVAPAETVLPDLEIAPEAGPAALREAAAAGDAKALFEVGSRFAEGRGVTADMAEASKYYERAAALGFAPAQYRIGSFYEKGLGLARNIEKAKSWYGMAADHGNASAMHNLAVLYAMGADGSADNQAAARWFQAAAELGVKDSQFNLGILTAKGVGMAQNLEESYKWFALVAKTGDKDAAGKRDEIGASLKPDALKRAQGAAELWKAKPLDAEANSVEIPESWQQAGDEKTASVDMKKAVKNVQMILAKNGYDAGRPDGVMGEKTKTAIATFQKDNGLAATGEVDSRLVDMLLARN